MAKKSGERSVTMATPKHGNGKLRVGSLPGNTPGTGRPKSAIRLAMREAFADRIPALADIADSDDSSIADRIRALDLFAKYGLGAPKAGHDSELVGKLAQAVMVEVQDEDVVKRIHSRWVEVIGSHITGDDA